MAEVNAQEMAAKLLAEDFARHSPLVEALSDPLVDTYIVVTLDRLRPYELDPRLTRNPRYEEIKASIRERGLDAPPPITRRPGAAHYIIRNGGNTRLAILRELWTETKEERFFRIGCLFRPWPERGEIIALTGHLAENELHGGLTFIERALGVQKASELYELETGKPLSQSELARRLKADGYPVPQPHISRMQEAIQYLLPAIPNLLYAGLGRHQIEQLTSLRRAAEKAYISHSRGNDQSVEFLTLFHEVLMLFDDTLGNFSTERVQDELIGQMAEQLRVPYDTLAFEIGDANRRWQALANEDALPQAFVPTPVATSTPSSPPRPAPDRGETSAVLNADVAAPPTKSIRPPTTAASSASTETLQQAADNETINITAHIVSPVDTTDRLQSLQRLIAEHTGEQLPDFKHAVLQAIPIQAGGLYPVTDIWRIEPNIDEPDRLRTYIAQLAREIAAEANLQHRIEAIESGIGYRCCDDALPLHQASSRTLLALLQLLSPPRQPTPQAPTDVDLLASCDGLGMLLLGTSEVEPAGNSPQRLSDEALVKLFRLMRLGRRVVDHAIGANMRESV